MQTMSFALAALYSGLWLRRWATDGVKNRMWPQLGWFSALVCAGSVAGAVAWSAQMLNSNLYWESIDASAGTQQQVYGMVAQYQQWYAAYFIAYGAEFLCLIAPKLMLLGRLIHNATRAATVRQTDAGVTVLSRSSAASGRVGRSTPSLLLLYKLAAAVIVMCSIACLVAFDVAAAFMLQAAHVNAQASAACDAVGNDTNSSIALNGAAISIVDNANSVVSVQSIFEALALTFISVAYPCIVAACVAMFRSAEMVGVRALASVADRNTAATHNTTAAAVAIVDDTIHASVLQRRRLMAACIVVLATFPVRAVFDLMNAYGNYKTDYNSSCPPCGSCQSQQWLIGMWLLFTPEFQPIAVALSSPLPLTVSLWLITAAHADAFSISVNVLHARMGNYLHRQPRAGGMRSPLMQ